MIQKLDGRALMGMFSDAPHFCHSFVLSLDVAPKFFSWLVACLY